MFGAGEAGAIAFFDFMRGGILAGGRCGPNFGSSPNGTDIVTVPLLHESSEVAGPFLFVRAAEFVIYSAISERNFVLGVTSGRSELQFHGTAPDNLRPISSPLS